VLVVVAAGLVMNGFHTAHEAGWLNVGQGSTFDMSWLVRTGTVRASLLTGILGLQPRPVVIELTGWLVYLIPIATYVAWPQGKRIAPRRIAISATALALMASVTAGVFLLVSPARPAVPRPVPSLSTLTRSATGVIDHGLLLERYSGTTTRPAPAGVGASQLTDRAVARLNGGRLPLGIGASSAMVPVTYSVVTTVAVDVELATKRVISTSSTIRVMAAAHAAVGVIPLTRPVSTTTRPPLAATVAAAVAAAHHDLSVLDRREDFRGAAEVLAALAGALLLIAGGAVVAGRRPTPRPPTPSLDAATSSLIERQVSLT
jgi:high-affinity iron transporter